MSIAGKVARIQAAKSAIADAIEARGVAVPRAARLDEYPALIESIQGGGSLEDIVIRVADFSDFSDDVVREGEQDAYARRLWA